MGEKKGYMVMTPVGAFKSPNDPECKVGQVASEVAHAAAAMLSPNVEGLHFIAATHAAHYKSCEACRAANPDPNPVPTEEDKAEAEAYMVKMEGIAKDPIAALIGVLGGGNKDELLAEMEKVLKAMGNEQEQYRPQPQQKRSIGFVN